MTTKLGGDRTSSAADTSGLVMATSVKSGGAVSVSMFDDPHLSRLPAAGLLLEQHHDTLLQGFVLPAQVGAGCVYQLDLIWCAFKYLMPVFGN